MSMKKVLLLLAEGFEVFEASAFIDVIGWNLVDGDMSTRLFTCALRKEIKSTFDQKFIVDYLIEEIDIHQYDALAIPGGFEQYGFYDDAFNERFLDMIRKFRMHGKLIASVCVGALPLAKSGIMKGLNGTTYNNEIRRNVLLSCGVKISEKLVVQDDKIITSCAPSTAIDVALLLLEYMSSKENANNIRELMGFKKSGM